MKAKYFRLSIWFLGLALLAASLVGANLAINSRAGDGKIKEDVKSEPAAPAGDGAVCLGFVDVEAQVTNLYPLQPGRVAVVLVREDQAVKKGDVLFRLEDRPAKFLLRQAEADLSASKARLKDAQKLPEKHRLVKAQQQQAILGRAQMLEAERITLGRLQKLVKGGNGAQEDADAAEAKVKAAAALLEAEEKKLSELVLLDPEGELKRAEADVAAKEAQLDSAKFALEECNIKAPLDGKVLRLFVHVGDSLGPQPKQPAVQFLPEGPRIVRAEIEQEFANRVSKGQTVTVQDDSKAGPELRGKVIRISDWYTHRRSIIQEPLQFNDVRTLECIIQLDPTPQPPRIGQRVRVLLGSLAQK
jgi:multidrug resistance efflux pump